MADKILTPEDLRVMEAEAFVQVMEEVKRRHATEGPEGGRYLVNGVLVDAEGRPVKAEKGR